VVRTRVGYAGGRQPNPTYRNIGDHTETLQIDFDPTQISYEALLNVFWQTHNPCATSWSRQYMSAVFVHDDHQRALAERTRDAEAKRRGAKVITVIQPVGIFTRAEDYHQKYILRQRGKLLREFEAMYPDPADFTDSTAAARVNGYLGGNGTAEMLEQEIDRLGLTPAGAQTLRGYVQR